MFDFMQMGNYTFYVWASVGSVIFVLSLMAFRAHADFKKLRQKISWSQHVQS